MTMPQWKEFERAVAEFASAMDPGASVRHDVHLPDRHTGRPRQRDVWIEARVCAAFPVRLLLSCKRWKRKVHSGDIDAFVGELDSSGAPKGVLYSYSGFTGPAIEKARAQGICCCRLYSNEPPELPETLPFEAYCCHPRISLNASGVPISRTPPATWQDVLELPAANAEGKSVLDVVVRRYHAAERKAAEDALSAGTFPSPFEAEAVMTQWTGALAPIKVTARGSWRVYRASLIAHMMDGSCSFTTGEFHGTQATPWIDRIGPEPGPGWELVPGESCAVLGNALMCVLFQGNAREVLETQLAPQQLGSRS